MTAHKFFICKKCGNIIGMIHDSTMPLSCCGQEMQELVPNTVDAAKEKHVPEVCIDGNMVHVHIGSTEHPMTLYKMFRGQEPTIDALLERNGIKRQAR